MDYPRTFREPVEFISSVFTRRSQYPGTNVFLSEFLTRGNSQTRLGKYGQKFIFNPFVGEKASRRGIIILNYLLTPSFPAILVDIKQISFGWKRLVIAFGPLLKNYFPVR